MQSFLLSSPATVTVTPTKKPDRVSHRLLKEFSLRLHHAPRNKSLSRLSRPKLIRWLALPCRHPGERETHPRSKFREGFFINLLSSRTWVVWFVSCTLSLFELAILFHFCFFFRFFFFVCKTYLFTDKNVEQEKYSKCFANVDKVKHSFSDTECRDSRKKAIVPVKQIFP